MVTVTTPLLMKISALTLVSSALAALTPIEVKGNAFYEQGSDTRFYIRGVDYQPGGASNASDPLLNEESCKRDIEKFKDLGLNMIRVYTVDNSQDHTACMQALDDAGIYLLLDVNTPKNSLNRYNETTLKLSYNSDYLQHVFATIDAFKGFDNLFGFFAANEVINAANNSHAAPYIKAVVRDMKTYISKQSDRAIPVGYSAADISDNRWEQMTYLNCGPDDERIDMFGMNDYSWCGDGSSFTQSGWSTNVENYGNYSIPLFLSEYGCNENTPRTFPEVKSLYSTDMSSVYSGGLVYEYSQEDNNYGLVEIEGDSVTELTDYGNLKKALQGATDPSGDGGASTDRAKAECPPYEEGKWEVKPDIKIPQTPKFAQKYFDEGAGEGKGLDNTPTEYGSNNDIDDKTNEFYTGSDGDETQDNSVSGSGSSASGSGSGSGSSSAAASGGSSASGSSGGSSASSGGASSSNAANGNVIGGTVLTTVIGFMFHLIM